MLLTAVGTHIEFWGQPLSGSSWTWVLIKINKTRQHMCVCTTGVYPHVQLSEWEKWWSIHGPIHLGTPCSKPVHPVMSFFLARKSTIYFHNCPIFNLPFTEVSTDLTVVEHCCQLPALSRASNLRRLHNPNQFPDSGGHWGAQRKFPAVALTLVILGGSCRGRKNHMTPLGCRAVPMTSKSRSSPLACSHKELDALRQRWTYIHIYIYAPYIYICI